MVPLRCRSDPPKLVFPNSALTIADVTGLRADTRYRYTICAPDGLAVAQGSLRTFPPPWDRTGLVFASASCDSLQVAGERPNPGAWDLLAQRVRQGDLRFLMLLGDQVYMDEVEDLWNLPLDIDRRERRRCLAEVYHRFW